LLQKSKHLQFLKGACNFNHRFPSLHKLYLLKHLLLIPVLAFFCTRAAAQKIDSIYFNLYTDSLKKGTFNYINVEGKLSNGNIRPMDSTQLIFTSSYGKFQGNSLWLPFDTKEEKVLITIKSKQNPSVQITKIIFIKKKGDDETLRSVNDILNDPKKGVRHRV